MKNLTKKRALLVVLFLLMGAPYTLHATKSVYQPIIQLQKTDCMALPSSKRKQLVHGYCNAYNIPTDICFVIRCLVYDNPLRYKNKPLPNDLAEQDLSGFDFTGCHFTYTNLTYTDLTDVILTNTTCDYQKAFLDNIKKNAIYGGDWCKNNLPNDLKSIAVVYPQLNNNTHKATLLQIACGLSLTPLYEYTVFYIKVQYWSLRLLQLKKMLSEVHARQLVCSLAQDLNDEAEDYCWKTDYPKDKVSIDAKALHAKFAQYLNNFHRGLIQYKCTSYYDNGIDWYKLQITLSINGLQEAYHKIKKQQLQQEACNIAYALSKSYQIQEWALIHHYLFCQHRLIRLEKSVDIAAQEHIYYDFVQIF